MFRSRIQAVLDSRREQGLNRQLAPLTDGNKTVFEQSGERYVNFSSNDYLGLATSQELGKAWQSGIDKYGVGSGASPLVTGFSSVHQHLENKLCDWLGYERAVLFGSGFSANQALLFSMLDKGDLLLQDKLNHASLMEAGMLSPATMKRFRHNDIAHCSSIVSSKSSDTAALVVTEGVFSMDGDRAPLKHLAELTSTSSAWLAVDDAHGIGVLGEAGRGSCDAVDVRPNILVVTFGKAFGLSGAAIMCDSLTGDYLTQFARHHVYSTAIPPSQAYALSHAVDMIKTQQWRRDKLLELNERYDHKMREIRGYQQTSTPIKPLLIGGSERAVKLATSLKSCGLWVTAIRPPTVPNGTARLRITLTANHQVSDIDKLAESCLRFQGDTA
ncbi:8-amino-7-oxononanoate synthase [Vibrio maerlii]|uniref:8-amino-7-oxononanoate synthase n=1 Tax=Vibrio maerlii TaxID=2231648 RepID=UPI001F12A29D|nr:8-amino-7-oxononanoate synthase [Vibrio maerlii]